MPTLCSIEIPADEAIKQQYDPSIVERSRVHIRYGVINRFVTYHEDSLGNEVAVNVEQYCDRNNALDAFIAMYTAPHTHHQYYKKIILDDDGSFMAAISFYIEAELF